MTCVRLCRVRTSVPRARSTASCCTSRARRRASPTRASGSRERAEGEGGARESRATESNATRSPASRKQERDPRGPELTRGEPRLGNAYLKYEQIASAVKAFEALNGRDFDGNTVKATFLSAGTLQA